jgi:NodT family efflux transporter outer membrane factor (OMF) lipoprotein
MTFRRVFRQAALLLALRVLAGCAQVYPPPQIPDDPAPAKYRPGSPPLRLPTVASGAQTLRQTAAPSANWWRVFGSPALDAMVEEGLAQNFSAKQAEHQLAAARQALKAGEGSSEFPAIDASLTPVKQRALNLPVFPQPTSQENIYTAQITASYTFDFFGQAFQSNRALASQVEQQAWQLQATRQNVALNIVAGAIRVAALGRQRELLQRELALAHRQAEWMAARQRLGSVAPDPVLQRQQQTESLAARLATCERELAQTRNSLAILLGRTPDRPPADIPLADLKLPQTLPLTVPSALLQQRPDILAARAAASAAADQAGAARAALFPSLTLSASMGRSGYNWANLTSPANAIWSVGAGLTQPLFHGGALRARKSQAEEQYQVALAQYRQTVIAAFSNVADTLARLEEDARLVSAMDTQNAQTRQLWQNNEARHRLGAGTRDDAATAEQSWLETQQQYAQVLAGRLTDSATLYNTLGAPVEAR